ncbi:M67 family metallopeptidase [Paenibacillus sp. GYB003]|uniref:M67 family metallopeptidase n=1 Tax=Paenibacillus sp. GYB003 TaxID=2994392 RepID=UPI002F96815A
MLRIERTVREAMIDHCRSKLPCEACGALFGPSADRLAPITAWAPIANRAADPLTSFAFDGREWIDSLYAAERDRLKLLGLFHSHPRTAAAPSGEDASAQPPGSLSYWIVSFAAPDRPVVASYIYDPHSAEAGPFGFRREPHTIV